jgi:hypothetical protein
MLPLGDRGPLRSGLFRLGDNDMGAFVKDHSVPGMHARMNSRFAPGDPLNEMVALQKEFQIFSLKHSLRKSFALLHIAPDFADEREGFSKYYDWLKRKSGSDIRGMNGHDRIITVIKNELESKKPLPIYFTSHLATPRNIKVLSSVKAPLHFSSQKYRTISLPNLRKK